MDYKKFYERVGAVIGWDFKEIDKRKIVVGKKWDFLEIVKNYVDKKVILLDIGTGGGEKLLQVSKFVKKAYGIDHSKEMIKTAEKNLVKSKILNVEFKFAEAKKIPYPDNFFDVVICRHSPFFVNELSRILKSKGIFITQHVGEKDKENIKKIFGRGQDFEKKVNTSMNKYINNLKKAKFTILRKDVYSATEYYYNMKDLIFLLKNTPIIPNFDIKKDRNFLKEIEQKYKTNKGIKTNSFRYLIIGRKSI